MERLFGQYKAIVASILGVVFIFHYLSIKFLLPIIEEKSQHNKVLGEIVILVITGTGIYVSVAFLPSKIYEKRGWRWLNPKYDFAGDWCLIITFKQLERPLKSAASSPTDSQIQELPKPYKSLIEITQSFFSIAMSGHTHDAEKWYSKVVTIIDEKNLLMVYELKRPTAGQTSLPPRALGVEEIAVTDRDEKGKPIELRGDFYHCVIPDAPLYRGVTHYRRITQWEKQQLRNQMRDG
jgi:hypothetical protein